VKIVIAGSGGRLGAALTRIYGASHEVAGLNRAALDLGSNDHIRQQLEPLPFDLLINCAALTNVDYCETHEEEAYQINAHAVREIAEICAAKKARCIHISTDYVFDGEKRSPYTEEDPANPISVYGRSKRAGEQELLKISELHLAVRVSWVFGPDRPSFLEMILKRAMEGTDVAAIGDKFSTPAYTHDLAEYLRPFLQEKPAGGLLHLCNAGECTWQEYGEHAVRCAIAAGMKLQAETVKSLKLDEMRNFVAKRPVYSVLDTSRFQSITGMTPRPWQAAVEEYVQSLAAQKNL
jgi:dTDP-4-dehydrorhamnose reductase